jgi:hypothetical protein
VLSPERLTPGCAVVLDLPHRILRLFPTTAAMQAWIRAAHGAAARLPVRSDTGSARTIFPPGYFTGIAPVGQQTITLGSLRVGDRHVTAELDTRSTTTVGTDVLAGYAIAFPRGCLDHLWLVSALR